MHSTHAAFAVDPIQIPAMDVAQPCRSETGIAKVGQLTGSAILWTGDHFTEFHPDDSKITGGQSQLV